MLYNLWQLWMTGNSHLAFVEIMNYGGLNVMSVWGYKKCSHFFFRFFFKLYFYNHLEKSEEVRSWNSLMTCFSRYGLPPMLWPDLRHLRSVITDQIDGGSLALLSSGSKIVFIEKKRRLWPTNVPPLIKAFIYVSCRI